MSVHEDRQDIAEVTVRYATAVDGRQWALLRECFTVDCQLDYGDVGVWDGIDAVIEHMSGSRVAKGGTSMHRITNHEISVDGDRAGCVSYVDAIALAPGDKSGFQALGRYDDELVRGEHGWRIARRRYTTIHIARIGDSIN